MSGTLGLPQLVTIFMFVLLVWRYYQRKHR
jgi:hypothetical protein